MDFLLNIELKVIWIAIITGVIPTLMWLFFWLREDRENPEPTGLLVLTFIAGALGVFVILPLDGVAEHLGIIGTERILFFAGAEEIIKLTGTSQKVIYKELPENDPKKRRPDITKAKKMLGWEPKVSRQEGLKITYDFFKSLLAG